MKLEISVATAAEMAQVSPKTIRGWIRHESLPLAHAGSKGPGRGARIDAIAFVRWLLARQAYGEFDLEQQRARLAKWQADRVHQDVEVRGGKLLPADDVESWVAAMIATAKTRILDIPAAVGNLLPREHAVMAETEARRIVHEALADLAATGSRAPRKANGRPA
jgi:hypothetical protein